MKKKSVYFSLLSLFILIIAAQNFVYAQEITIGKYKYPSIILIPIISILVSVIILLFLGIRIIMRGKKEFIKDAAHGIHEIKHEIKKDKKTKKVEKEDKQKEESYLGEIRRFKRRLHSLDPEKAFEILSAITKTFLKELLSLNTEVTYGELAKELKNKGKRKELIEICDRFSELRYGGVKISKDELGRFADELEVLLKKEKIRKEEEQLGVSRALHSKASGGLFGGLFGTQTMPLAKETKESGRKKRILDTMRDEEEALKKDMDIAKNIYHKLLADYYKLPPKEKKEVYEKLKKFYNNINEMLFSSVYSEKSKKEMEYFASKLEQIEKDQNGIKIEPKPLLHRLKPQFKEEEQKTPAIELKHLENIEQQAKERLKIISQSIVKHAIQKEEKTPKQEIGKKVNPFIMSLFRPASKPAETKVENKLQPLPKQEMKEIPSIDVKPHVFASLNQPAEQQKKGKGRSKPIHIEQKVPLKSKNKKIASLEKEAEHLKAKIAKL